MNRSKHTGDAEGRRRCLERHPLSDLKREDACSDSERDECEDRLSCSQSKRPEDDETHSRPRLERGEYVKRRSYSGLERNSQGG